MRLKLTNDLYLGLQEIQHLVDAIKKEGYQKIFKQMISSYGVVKPYHSQEFTNLQVVDSALGKITIRAGIAIDNELNIIDVKQDLVDVLTVSPDNISRYVVISYKETVIEEGDVDIQQDGTIMGSGTRFTKRLRGLPNFASVVEFPYSTKNTGKYIVQSVQSDTIASLNVAAGILQDEQAQKYRVVGTFTPGTIQSSNDEYPFINDGYKIELRASNNVIEGKEFLLAKVTNNAGNLTINDLRVSNIFTFLSKEVDTTNILDLESPLITVTEMKFKHTPGPVDSSVAKLEFGFFSDSWSINPATRILKIYGGSGGSWEDISWFYPTAVIGHYVVFEDGQSAQIIDAQNNNGVVELELEYQNSYKTSGKIVVAPLALLDVKIKHKTKNFFYRHLFLGFQGLGYFELAPGDYVVEYRLIDGNKVSEWRKIRDHDYYAEPSFDENGYLLSGNLTYYSSSDGEIGVQESDKSFFKILSQIVFPGVIWDFNGEASDIPEGWVECNGDLINAPGSIFDGTHAPDLRGRVTVGLNTSDNDFHVLNQAGGTKEVTLTRDHLPDYELPVSQQPHRHGAMDTSGSTGTSHDVARQGDNYDGTYDNHTSNETIDITVELGGGGQAHPNLQPYRTYRKIMKL